MSLGWPGTLPLHPAFNPGLWISPLPAFSACLQKKWPRSSIAPRHLNLLLPKVRTFSYAPAGSPSTCAPFSRTPRDSSACPYSCGSLHLSPNLRNPAATVPGRAYVFSRNNEVASVLAVLDNSQVECAVREGN